MGISISAGAYIGSDILEDADKPIVIGDSQSGIIVHGSPGETIEGVNVEADNWVEIYGEEVHFSESN